MPLWTGDGTTSKEISGAKFNVANKSLVWIKNRDFGTHHVLTDTARGAGNWIESSSPNKQNYALSIVSNFKSDGFVIGNSAAVNTNLEKYVAWVYNMIPRFGMQTLRWTGTGVNRLVPHDLGVAPELVITKDLTEDNRNWLVGSDALTSWAYVLDLNLNIFETSTSLPYNGLAPTASDINIGTSQGTNKLNNEYVAYIFRSVPGFSKTGVFYGTGGTDENAFVQTDFPVAYLMVKSIDTNGSWVVLDRGRKKYNPIGNYLAPDLTNVEGANQWFDFYHNGFKGRIGLISGNRYFYLAFADHPFKYATAR